MDLIAVMAAVLGAPAGLAFLWYLSSRRNRRGGNTRRATGGMLGIVDEIFRPETHQAYQVQEIQHELPAPAPVPGDPKNPSAKTFHLD
jgi:hypothetical protein